MAGRRSNGEETADFNEKRQRWEAQMTYKDKDGTTRRKMFTGKTQRGVNKKKKEWVKNFDDGLLPEADKLTVGTWIDRWLENYYRARAIGPCDYCHDIGYIFSFTAR